MSTIYKRVSFSTKRSIQVTNAWLLLQRIEYTRHSLPLRKYCRKCFSLYETKDNKVPYVGSLWKENVDGTRMLILEQVQYTEIFALLVWTVWHGSLVTFDFPRSPQYRVRKSPREYGEVMGKHYYRRENCVEYFQDSYRYLLSTRRERSKFGFFFLIARVAKWEGNATVDATSLKTMTNEREAR